MASRDEPRAGARRAPAMSDTSFAATDQRPGTLMPVPLAIAGRTHPCARRSTVDAPRHGHALVDPDESVAAGSAPTPPPPAAALPPLRGLRLLSLELGPESRPATRRSGAPRSGRSLHRAGYAG